MKFSDKTKNKIALSALTFSMLLSSAIDINAATLTINSTSNNQNYPGAEFKIKSANNDFLYCF